jgi:hypothetical protein
MAKLILDDIALTGANLETLINVFNENMARVETAIENTLSRDGTTPNFMDADLDLNGYCLLNVGCVNFVPGGGDNLAYYNRCNQYIAGQATAIENAVINGGVYTPVCCASNVHRIYLDQDVTLGAPVGALDGQVMNFIIKQDGVGGRTVTWNPIYKWGAGSAPLMTSDPNAKDIVSMQYDTVDEEWICVVNQDIK